MKIFMNSSRIRKIKIAKNLKKSSDLAFWLVIYRLSLDLVYVLNVAPRYGYYGLKLDIEWLKYVISWIVLIIYSILVKKFFIKTIRTSALVVLALFSMSFIPTSSFYALSNQSNRFFFYLSVYWGLILLLELFFARGVIQRIAIVSVFKNQKIKTIGLEILTILFGIYVFFTSYRYNRLYLRLSIDNVYDLRIAAKATDFGVFSGYLLTWAAVVFAFAALRYYDKKKWIRFGIYCYLQLLLFSMNGMKSTLFFIPIALLGYKFITVDRITYLPLGLALLNFISMIVFYIFNNIMLIFLIPFRVYFLPALLSKQYYEFFSNNPPDMLAQSVLRRFGIVSRYPIPIPNLIDLMNRDGTGYANTGMFGDAFANFGSFGAILYPFLLIGILKILDMVTAGLKVKSYIAIVLVIAISFTNVSFFTALLNNGLLFSFFLLLLNRRPEKYLIRDSIM
ncbi:MAG: hypothetical protein ACYC2S_13520 [Spirochaetales bacterium]